MSIHLSIEGIRGNSADANYPGWIDLLDIEWGVHRRVTSHSSRRGSRESANAEITDLTFTKFVDSSTPGLFLEACCGKGKEMRLDLTKTGSGNGAASYMTYTLKNALLTDYRVEHLALRSSKFIAEPRPVEIITISFLGMESRYTPYDDDGAAQAPIVVGFDTTRNARL